MKLYFKKITFCSGLLILVSLVLCSVYARAETGSQKPSVQKVEYTSQGYRDPFVSVFEMAYVPEDKPPVGDTLSHLKVQGMIWGSEMPQAIINNTVVKVGEVISGAEILEIRKEGIYVLHQGRQYILRPTISKK